MASQTYYQTLEKIIQLHVAAQTTSFDNFDKQLHHHTLFLKAFSSEPMNDILVRVEAFADLFLTPASELASACEEYNMCSSLIDEILMLSRNTQFISTCLRARALFDAPALNIEESCAERRYSGLSSLRESATSSTESLMRKERKREQKQAEERKKNAAQAKKLERRLTMFY